MDTASNLQINSVGAFSIGGWNLLLLAAESLRLEPFIIGHRKSKRPTNRLSESVEMVNKSHSTVKRVTRKF